MKKTMSICLLMLTTYTLIGMSRAHKKEIFDPIQGQNPRIFRIWQDDQANEEESILDEEDDEE